MKRTRLAIVLTHPTQYYAPVFRALAASTSVSPKVFYTWSNVAEGTVPDGEFGKAIRWDIPLREGYEHEFVHNVSANPGVDHFRGVRNPELIPRITSWGAEAVLVFGWNLASHFQAMRHFKGRVPVFFLGDSTLLDEMPPWRSLARWLVLTGVYRHIDVAIAVGQNNRDYFRRYGVPAERVLIAPHSIDTERFGAATASHRALIENWRSEMRIREGEVVFLFAGKLTHKKNPQLLLDAFLQSGGQGHLVFCGNGDLEDVLKSRAGGCARVHFLPFQNQSVMPAVYRLGDLCVLPSQGPGETWGLALNEAMACGRPVIASSRVGAARDLIESGVTGWVFESGNQAQLIEILTLAAREGVDALRKRGEAARRVSQRWSSESSATRIADIVSGCARERET
jgi:glycosyltransferase involved in cell wall biosynthesis